MREYVIEWDGIPEPERSARRYERVPERAIEHSGCRFISDVATHLAGWGMVLVWPIEELLARTRYQPAQSQRLRKLNRYGKAEGAVCPGFYPVQA